MYAASRIIARELRCRREPPARRASAAAQRRPIARNAILPSPGSPNVRPASGVQTRMTSTAEPLTKPTAAAGASGRSRTRHVEDGGEREAGGEAHDERGDRRRPRAAAPTASTSTPAEPAARLTATSVQARSRRAAHGEAAGGPRHDPREEHEPADHAGDAASVALALEQRHDPVPGHDREPERRHLHGGERPEAPVAEARCAAACLVRVGCATPSRPVAPRATGSAPASASASPVQYGRPPAERRRRAAARPSGRARRPPSWRRRRRPARTGRPCPRGRDRCPRRSRRRCRCPSATRAPRPSAERRSDQRDRVPRRDDRERREPDAARADPVDQASTGDLHGQVRDEERGRQQPDGRERDAVARAQVVRRSRRRWRCSTSRPPRARARRRSSRGLGYVSETRAIVLSASRSSAATDELEVLLARVLELRVRQPAQALHEHHHGRDARARRPRPRRAAARTAAGARCRRPRGRPRRRGRSGPRSNRIGSMLQIRSQLDLDVLLGREALARLLRLAQQLRQAALRRGGAGRAAARRSRRPTSRSPAGRRRRPTCRRRRSRRAPRSRGSRARASPRRRARRGACPSASSRRAPPGPSR